MHVLVIGAGLIGCATAYQLLHSGHTVELLEAAPDVGRGSSLANGAQLSYSYVEPLANPATLRSLPKLLLERESAFKLRPQVDPQQWRWLLAFARACTQTQASAGTRELLALASLSRHTLETWMQEQSDWAVSFARNGKLVLCRDQAMLDRQAAQVRLQAQWGCDQQVLSREACIAQEPTLARSSTPFVGGVWTASECVADPHLLCQALAKSAMKRGAKLHVNHTVTGWEVKYGRFAAVQTSQARLEADACVIAAGTASVQLARQLGIHLPIYPIKGYSLTLQLRKPQHVARCSITDLGLKTVFAPLRGQLRIAAAAEIVGHDVRIDHARVQQMLRAADALFPGACDAQDPQAWAGLRPATPNSLPIMGASQIPGVWLNVGHGALGLTLAAGSAVQLVQKLIEYQFNSTPRRFLPG
jgi:D-amino-acid dehydrogenase